MFADGHEKGRAALPGEAVVPAGKPRDGHQAAREVFDDAGEAAETVRRGAKVASKVAKATGQVADAVGDVAEAGDKVQKAFTAVLGLSTGGSTLLGGVGDFLRPAL